MHSAVYAEEIELKSAGFCELCRALLRRAAAGRAT
jgi:hypothetical protein